MSPTTKKINVIIIIPFFTKIQSIEKKMIKGHFPYRFYQASINKFYIVRSKRYGPFINFPRSLVCSIHFLVEKYSSLSSNAECFFINDHHMIGKTIAQQKVQKTIKCMQDQYLSLPKKTFLMFSLFIRKKYAQVFF